MWGQNTQNEFTDQFENIFKKNKCTIHKLTWPQLYTAVKKKTKSLSLADHIGFSQTTILVWTEIQKQNYMFYKSRHEYIRLCELCSFSQPWQFETG